MFTTDKKEDLSNSECSKAARKKGTLYQYLRRKGKKYNKRGNALAGRVHTITADNGKEFAKHQEIAKELQIYFYFCKPYHSWERGANENTERTHQAIHSKRNGLQWDNR
jgi:hypothetical protein